MTTSISEVARCPEGLMPVRRNFTIWASVQPPTPVFLSGVMFAGRLPSGPGPPARKRDGSGAPLAARGVWQSTQCAGPFTRYSPRATPLRGAVFGATATGMTGIGVFNAGDGTRDVIGGTLLRYAASARASSSAMLLKTVYGWIGNTFEPSGRSPRRIAFTTCASVHFPMPVSGSGVMLAEYTVPNGPSNLRPPALRPTPSCGVWQAHPPA